MRLLDDDTEEEKVVTAPPADPPPAERVINSEHVETQSTRPPVLRIIAAIVIIAILAFLILLFARWLYHKIHHSASTDTGGATLNVPEHPSGAGNQNPAQPQPSTTTPPSTSNSLPNNGPGNVAAVFAASALAAAGLHYIISLRRFNKTGN